MLEAGSEPRKLRIVEAEDAVVIDEDDTMRIAHRDRSDAIFATGDGQRVVDDMAIAIDRDFAPFENRRAHIDSGGNGVAAGELERDGFGTAVGIDHQRILAPAG